MISGPAKTIKWWCSGADFCVICENYMLWSGNLGLKMGGLKNGTYPICTYMEVPPPPPSELCIYTLYALNCNLYCLKTTKSSFKFAKTLQFWVYMGLHVVTVFVFFIHVYQYHPCIHSHFIYIICKYSFTMLGIFFTSMCVPLGVVVKIE